MKGEFQRVITGDGLELHGLLMMPDSNATHGIIHVHGLAGNFYENRFIDHVSDVATRLGFAFLTVNTRGRDYISDFLCIDDGSITYKQIGAIYEIFEECILDIDAWIDFLKDRGIGSIILQGHSHGALKVVYYISKKPDSPVSGTVLLSPSDDFGLQRAALGERFDEALAISQKMISEGKARELMPREYFHYPVSAASYYDIFRPDSPLKIFNISETDTSDFHALSKIHIPTLVLVGSVEEAFIGEPQAYLASIRSKMIATEDFTGKVIRGAPHNYLGYETELASLIEDWLAEHRRSLGNRKPRGG